MNGYRKYLFLLLVGIALGVVGMPVASASDFSAVVWPAEGNVTCSDYSANKVILSMGTNSLVAGTTGTLTGPANPQDGDGDTNPETATYSLSSDGTTFSYSADTPINYVVLKSNKDVAVAIYKTGGVRGDGDLTITRNGVNEPIDAVSLCYGLPGQQVAQTTAVPTCSNVGVTVPGTQPQLVYRFDLNPSTAGAPFYNPKACVTGTAKAVQCNPQLPAGQPGSCFPTGSTTTGPKEVVSSLQLNNDPYYCLTLGGIRTCYYYSY